MSYAMKVAKAQAMGDPGLLGFLGKAIGGVAKIAGGLLPGPIGGIAKLVGNVLVPAKSVKTATVTASLPGIGLQGTAPQFPAPIGTGIQIGGQRGVQIGAFPQFGPGGGGGPGPGTAVGPLMGGAAGTPCARGYHFNRTGYYTKRYGWIEKGSVCVKNRRRNPLNPRALSRSLARLTSAKRAVRCLADFTVRSKKACGCR